MPTIRAIALVLFLAVARNTHGEATLSLKAIARNGQLIIPTNSLSVAPGDIITAEVFFSGWSTPPFDYFPPPGTGLLQTFQATLMGAAGAVSNGADPVDIDRLVLPVGWVAPITREFCPCDNPAYPTCDPQYGCVGSTHTPAAMAHFSTHCTASNTDIHGGHCTGACCVGGFRSDSLFYSVPNQTAVDHSSLNIRWGGTIDGFDAQFSQRCHLGANAGGICTGAGDCPGGTCDASFQSYAGTLNLKVGSQSCGSYTFTFANDIGATFIANAAANPVTRVPVNIHGLTLNTGISCPQFLGACCEGWAVPVPVCTNGVHASACTGEGKRFGGLGSTCATINPPCLCVCDSIGSSPPHCTIDARIPQWPNEPDQRFGFKSITFIFQTPPGSSENAPDDFQVTQIPELPAPPNPPPIQSVTQGGNTVTIRFPDNNPIQPNRWTCIRHIASNKRACLGSLPGDANGNGAALPSDILALIDHLNQLSGAWLPLHLCDIDRSGECLPADIITEIDLLIGNGFPNQNGDSLPPCPSMTP